MTSRFRKRRIADNHGEAGAGSTEHLEQVPSQGVNEAVPSPTRIAEAEHGSPSFLRAVLDILRRLFQLLLFHSSILPATDSDIKHKGKHEVADTTIGKPLYKPLKSGQIRVYCMNRHQSGPITGQLRTIQVDREPGFFKRLASPWPRYEALSYCWGDPAQTHSLHCNGHEVKIHANLHDALLVLRQKRPEVPVWTDAICIDQENETEKFTQIQFMGKIYGSARKVWAFLGNGPAGIDEAMPFLPVLCKSAKKIEERQKPRIKKLASQGTLRPTSLNEDGIQRVKDLPSPRMPFWTTIFNLVYSEYFDRLWVIQEVGLATRIEFLCGTHQISWTQMKALFGPGVQQIEGFIAPPSYPPLNRNTSVFDMREILRNEDFTVFQRVYLYLFELYWPWVVTLLRRNLDEEDANLQPVMRIVNDLDTLMKSQQLERMLDIAVMQECSKPEDRIFAFLSLFEAKTKISSFPWKAGQSVPELYVEAFYFLVPTDAKLQLLSMAPDDLQSPLCLPSWCPTFHRRWQSGTTQRMGQIGGIISNEPGWQASRRKQTISRGSDNMKLRLDGIQICAVHVVPGSWTAINMKPDPATDLGIQDRVQANFEWLTLCLHTIFQDADTSSPSYHEKLERFWRIMLLDNIGALGEEDSKLDDWQAVMALLERSVSPDSSFAQERTIFPRTELGPGKVYQEGPREHRFLVTMDLYITHKVFFVMENGMFGMTYQGVQTGDTLCVIQGAKMAHLLRHRDEGSWTFVGEAFVPGIMHGEAEDAVNGVRLETETFVLV